MPAIFGTIGTIIFICIVAGGLWGCPQYNVYSQRLVGEAELARAEQNKQIRIQSSDAKLKAATLDARAEVELAKGVAEANRIIADSLGGPEGYLRWRYIQMLEETGEKGKGRDVIYIPTEAGLPVLEAGKRPSHD